MTSNSILSKNLLASEYMKHLNKYIEHTNIHPAAKKADILNLCFEAKKYQFRSVCVNPEWSMLCKEKLRDTGIKIVIVYNFPTSKSRETRFADEIDLLVQARGCSTKEGRKKLEKQLQEAKQLKFNTGLPIKIVIETHILIKKEIKLATKLITKYKLDYVKSSTGLYNRIHKILSDRTKDPKGLQIIDKAYSKNNFEDLKYIKKGLNILGIIPRKFLFMYTPKIKIAGGITYYKDAENLLQLGSDLLGASKGIKMIIDQKADKAIEEYKKKDK